MKAGRGARLKGQPPLTKEFSACFRARVDMSEWPKESQVLQGNEHYHERCYRLQLTAFIRQNSEAEGTR